VKRYALWALMALITWWIVQDPTSAAHFVHGIGGAFSHAAPVPVQLRQRQLAPEVMR
jgi:hypothetical protein